MGKQHVSAWKAPIVLLLDGESSLIAIHNVCEAARFLVANCPPVPGIAFRKAVSTCFAALEGAVDSERARFAFLAAAHEVGIAITLT